MKKAAFALSLLCLFCGSIAAQDTYSNPIISKSLPDPTVIRDADGTYWLYATEDTHNVPIYSSTNLVDWKFVGTAFTDATRPKMVSGGGIWAPEIVYHNGKYILYYSKSVWGGEWTCGIGAATADHPFGPFTDHGKLFLSNEIDVQNSIDQFFFSEDGHNYLFWGSFHGIYGIELSEDGLSVKEGAEKVKVASGFMEGTNIVKHGDWYYLIGSNGSCCEGAKSTYKVVVNRSKSLFGPYVNRSGGKALDGNFSNLLTGSSFVVGPGHNSRFVQDDAGTDWMIYHGYLKSNADAGRVTFMDPIVWDKAGWPTVKTGHPSTKANRPVIDAAAHEVGKSQVPLADPFILLDGDTYYAYGTHSADGIEVYTSDDLQTWTLRGLALSKDNTSEKKNFWAPEVYRRGDKYYMYYSANEHLFVAIGDSPLGPFIQHGSYLLEPLRGDEKCIDGTVFTDEDGKMTLFFVRFTDGNVIWSCDLDEEGLAPAEGTSLRKIIAVTSPWEKKLGTVAEGPFVIRHDDKYILSYSANDYQSPWYAVGTATSKALERGWGKYKGNPILCMVDELVGTGHHSFFTDKEGNLRIVFHAHHSTGAIHPRMMYIGTMTFNADGYLVVADEPIIRPQLAGDVSVAAQPAGQNETNPVVSVYDLSGRPLSSGNNDMSLSGPTIQIERRQDGSVSKQAVPEPEL